MLRFPPLVLALFAGGLPALEVRLHPEAVIAARWADLGQVADLAGATDEVAAARGVPVAALGSGPVAIDGRAVRLALAGAGLPAPAAVTGSCRARQPLLAIAPERLVAVAGAALIAPGEDAEAAPARPPGPLAVADDGTAPELVAVPLDRSRTGQVPVRIEVRRDGTEVARTLVVLDLRRFVRLAVLAAPLRKGREVGVGDLRLERLAEGPLTRHGFADPAAAVGRVALRDLAAGTPLTTDLVAEAPAVVAGQEIALLVHRGDVEVSAPGIAAGSGRVGERISVRRTGDPRGRWARITGPGRVEME